MDNKNAVIESFFILQMNQILLILFLIKKIIKKIMLGITKQGEDSTHMENNPEVIKINADN